MIWLTIACSLVSSMLYRAGGLSQEEKYWIPLWLRHSWVRDWLCPLFCLLPLFLQHPSWWFVLAYGAMGGAFSTYLKVKGVAQFWLAGLVVGLACSPLIFAGFVWWKVLLRASLISGWWGIWSEVVGNDHIEEHGRGFLACIFDLLL